MARDSNGNYTLPVGNPVVSGTTIQSSWANTTMSDIASALTNSLDRTGNGSMQAPLLNFDGAVGSPGIAFGNEPGTGFYRVSVGVMGVSILGQQVASFSGGSLQLVDTDAGASAGPFLNLVRNSASPANSDVGGQITFTANNDQGNPTIESRIRLLTEEVQEGFEAWDLRLGASGSEVVINNFGGLEATSLTSSGATFASSGSSQFTVGNGALYYEGLAPNVLQVGDSKNMQLRINHSSGNQLLLEGPVDNQNASFSMAGDNLTINSRGETDPGSIIFTGNDTVAGPTVEFMRIASSGDLLVGTDSESNIIAGSDDAVGLDGSNGVLRVSKSGTGAATTAAFYNPNGTVGSISISGTSTSFNTSSDVRLKENIKPSMEPGFLIDTIEVVQFNWKADGAHQAFGFIAQDLEPVAPEAVTKGETEDDMWGVDPSKLVPMLLKEIQSLRRRLDALEARN